MIIFVVVFGWRQRRAGDVKVRPSQFLRLVAIADAVKGGDNRGAFHAANSGNAKMSLAIRAAQGAISRDVLRLARIGDDFYLALQPMDAANAPKEHLFF